MDEYYKIYYCHFCVRRMLLKMRQFLHFQMDASDVKMTIINFVILAH